MEILLNGKTHKMNENCTILSLLNALNIAHKAVAIAVNTQVVKSKDWESFWLQNGDEVEILDFVGGG